MLISGVFPCMKARNTYHFPFARYPAIRLVLLLSAGILVDYSFDIPFSFWVGAFALTTICFFILEFALQNKLKTELYSTSTIFYLLMIIAFGGLSHSLSSSNQQSREIELLNTYSWQKITFRGEIYHKKKTEAGNTIIDLAIDSTVFLDSLISGKHFNLRASINPKEISLPKNMRLGNQLTFSAIILPMEEIRNPSQFNYKEFLASRDIYVQAKIIDISDRKMGRRFTWNRIRGNVLSRIEHIFSPETAPLAKALLIGYKNELPAREKQNFSRSGLSHIMAVSGLHVGFIIAPFWIIIPLFWSFRYGRQLGLILLITLLIFYAGLTGFSASVVRASLVGGFLAYGRLFHKVRDSKNLTAAAALIILLINPEDLFSIGFQLSFCAVYVILLILPLLTRIVPDTIQFRWYGKPIMIILVSIVVQIGLFPLLTFYFGEFSLISPIANALVVPLLGFAVPYSLFLLLFSNLIPQTTIILIAPVDYLLKGIHQLVSYLANLPGSWVAFHAESFWLFIIWILAILMLAALFIPRLRWKILILLLIISSIRQAENLIQKMQAAPLSLTVFDVGQGDAALLTTPAGKHFLIDAGRWQPSYNSAEEVIIPHLEANGIKKLDGVFLSHPHADHIGGILNLLEEIPIDTIYNSGSNYDSKLFNNYHNLAIKNNIPIVSLSSGQILTIDPSVRLFTYGPISADGNSNVNNSSLVFEIIYGQSEFLFMGDAEKAQEVQLSNYYPDFINTDYLKVPHHGSKTSSSTNFLQMASPSISSVSVGMRNRFNHPNVSAVKRLREYSDNLLFTSLEGAIILESDGKNIQRKVWR